MGVSYGLTGVFSGPQFVAYLFHVVRHIKRVYPIHYNPRHPIPLRPQRREGVGIPRPLTGIIAGVAPDCDARCDVLADEVGHQLVKFGVGHRALTT
jgi:hypothetical protein